MDTQATSHWVYPGDGCALDGSSTRWLTKRINMPPPMMDAEDKQQIVSAKACERKTHFWAEIADCVGRSRHTIRVWHYRHGEEGSPEPCPICDYERFGGTETSLEIDGNYAAAESSDGRMVGSGLYLMGGVGREGNRAAVTTSRLEGPFVGLIGVIGAGGHLLPLAAVLQRLVRLPYAQTNIGSRMRPPTSSRLWV